MQNYLIPDLIRIVREYEQDWKEDYNKVVEELGEIVEREMEDIYDTSKYCNYPNYLDHSGSNFDDHSDYCGYPQCHYNSSKNIFIKKKYKTTKDDILEYLSNPCHPKHTISAYFKNTERLTTGFPNIRGADIYDLLGYIPKHYEVFDCYYMFRTYNRIKAPFINIRDKKIRLFRYNS